MYRLLMTMTLVMMAGCASISIDQPASRPLDASAARSWRYWQAAEDAAKDEPLSLDEQRVRKALEQEFERRGIAFVAQGTADLTLRYRFNDEIRLQGSGMSYGFGFGRGNFGLGAMTDTDARAYKEQQLILEVVNPDTNGVVWSAAAQKYLTASHSSVQREKLIGELVSEMLDVLLKKPAE